MHLNFFDEKDKKITKLSTLKAIDLFAGVGANKACQITPL